MAVCRAARPDGNGIPHPVGAGRLLTLFIVYRIGARLVSARAGLLAAIVLATTFRFLLYARQGLTDVPVTAMVTLSIWGFLSARDAAAGRSRRFALLGWAATGAAALIKGPVAVFGPLVWGIYLLAADRTRDAWRRVHAPTGVLVAAAVALPWHIAMIVLHGRAFLDVALGYEVVARYASPDFPGRDRGFFYYYGVWFGDAAPWSIFFVAAIVWSVRAWSALDSGCRRVLQLSAIWFATVLVVFSFSSYKLPHYIMPAFPPTALVVGVFADAVLRGRVASAWLWRVPVALTSMLLAAGAVLLSLLLLRAFLVPATDASMVLPAVMIAGAVALAGCVVARRDRLALQVLLVALVAAYAWIVIVISPRELRRFQPIPELGRTVQRVAAPGDPLAVAGNYGAPGLVFYAHRPVRQLVNREELIQYLSEPGPRYCVLPQTDFESVRPEIARQYRIVDSGDVFSVRMRRLLERDPERAGRTLVLVGPR
jgi:4-amino-4-deoxy-L-arabinose transferase-like glycosyltransferase